jgi:hypothetical protein
MSDASLNNDSEIERERLKLAREALADRAQAIRDKQWNVFTWISSILLAATGEWSLFQEWTGFNSIGLTAPASFLHSLYWPHLV